MADRTRVTTQRERAVKTMAEAMCLSIDGHGDTPRAVSIDPSKSIFPVVVDENVLAEVAYDALVKAGVIPATESNDG